MQTVASEKVRRRRFKLKNLNLKLKDTLDLPGSKDQYPEWKQLLVKSDVVLYLLRADRLIIGDKMVEARVRDDVKHIGEWLDARSPRPQLFVIGTHCDLDEEYQSLSDHSVGNYLDNFRKLPIMTEVVLRGGGANDVKVSLGSLKTKEETEKLVIKIFNQARL